MHSSGTCVGGFVLDRCSLELCLKFLTLEPEHLSEALSRVRILFLAEICGCKAVVEGRDFLDLRLADLLYDLFLLNEELVRVDLWLLFNFFNRLCHNRRILFGLFALSLELSKLLYFLLFLPLLLRIDARHHYLWRSLSLRLWLLCYFLRILPVYRRRCRSCCRRWLRLDCTCLDSLLSLGGLLLEQDETLLFLSLAGFNSESDHLLLFLSSAISILLGYF